jgi:ankyrin repeat protein
MVFGSTVLEVAIGIVPVYLLRIRRAGSSCCGLLAALLVVANLQAADADRLIEAIKGHDRAGVQSLLTKAVDVNATEPDGTTALHWAANWGDPGTVDLLIKAGAKVSAENRYGMRPLSVAAANGQARVIEKLLAAGADPNTVFGDGESVLMTAARTGSVPAVNLLLAHGAHPNAAERWRGQTALMWAAVENHPGAVKALIEGGADIDARSSGGLSALMFAARAGHIDVARALLDAGATSNETGKDGSSTLGLAALNAHWELGMLLLENGADPNADLVGWTPLHQVALTRSPHHDNVNPQRIPTGTVDSLDFAKALVAHGAEINRRTTKSPTDGFRQWIRREGATAFFFAAKAADVPLMRLLVSLGADPSIPTAQGVTALAAAAGVGFCQGESPGTEAEALEAVKYTLTLGGDVNAVDENGFTPMHGAATRGANTIVQLLHDRGARLDAKSKEDGWTPWTMANGVMLANTYKRQLATADYIRELMDRGK